MFQAAAPGRRLSLKHFFIKQPTDLRRSASRNYGRFSPLKKQFSKRSRLSLLARIA